MDVRSVLIGWVVFLVVVYVVMAVDALAHCRRVVVFCGRWLKALAEDE